MCMDGLLQLMMPAKPQTKLIRTNLKACYVLIMLMPKLNQIYRINRDKNTCKLH